MKQLVTKLSAIALMTLLSSNVMATDYYISATGNDANDGMSLNAAFATLSKAIATMKNDDILYVSGFIKMDAQYQITAKRVTIQGTNPLEDGFDGQNKSGIIKLQQADCTLKNLTFKNGSLTRTETETMGSAITSYGSIVNIDGCIFENNTTTDATKHNANQTGGALFVNGTRTTDLVPAVSLTIKNSQFKYNKSDANGGAASIFEVPTTIENCVFEGNECYTSGGALNFSTPKSYIIKQCCFVGNSAAVSKGVINVYLRNSTNMGPYDIVSSTFYNNSAATESSVMGVDVQDALDKRTFNFYNCTLSGNVLKRNANGEGCVRIYGPGANVNITNSIFEGNTLNNAVYRDLAFAGTTGSEMAYINSVIGSIYSNGETTTSTSSLLNKTVNMTDTKNAGLASFQTNCFPLYQASLATNLGTSENRPATDQLGTVWTENYIGAVQKTVEPEDGVMYAATLDADGNVDKTTISRKLVGGEWNTICVPFNLNNKNDDPDRTEFKACFGEGANIAFLYNGQSDGENVKDGILTFTDRSNYNIHDIVAARAYLVKPVHDVHVIISKKVTNTNPGSQVTAAKDANGNAYYFRGVLTETDLKTTDVCLGRGGSFFHPAEDKTKMPGLRGYFQFPANANVSSAKVYVGGVSDTTDIIDLKAIGKAKNAKIYTLGGQYVGTDAETLPKGIYVIGNKKVVIK